MDTSLWRSKLIKINKEVQLTIFFLIFPFSSYAYLDPGSGSLIVQAIVGAIAGGIMFIKLYWEKVKAFFSKTEEEKDVEEN